MVSRKNPNKGLTPDLYQMMCYQSRHPFSRRHAIAPHETVLGVLVCRNSFDDCWFGYSLRSASPANRVRPPHNIGGVGGSCDRLESHNQWQMNVREGEKPRAIRKLEALIRNCGAFICSEEVLLHSVFGLCGRSPATSKQIVGFTGKFSVDRLYAVENTIARLLKRLTTDAPWVTRHIPENWRSSENMSLRSVTISEMVTALQPR